MIRAFVAIELPNEVRAALRALQERLQRARLGVKVTWTTPANLHLTLQFLGYVPNDKLPSITRALDEVARETTQFTVPVSGVGGFPHDRAPRVLWVGCGNEAGRLRALAAAVEKRLTPLGFSPERREFVPHLTLGRVKWPRPDAALTKALDSLRDCACGTLRVDALHLFQSQLQPHGSIYTKLSSHPLTGERPCQPRPM